VAVFPPRYPDGAKLGVYEAAATPRPHAFAAALERRWSGSHYGRLSRRALSLIPATAEAQTHRDETVRMTDRINR
jgi:hypothetical protein